MDNSRYLTPASQRTHEERVANGRKGGKKSQELARQRRERVKDLIAAFGVEPLSADMVREADCILLAMTDDQLRAFVNNAQMPVYMRRRARLLMAKEDNTAFETSERMLDRAFGKPKQAVDVGATTPPIVQVIDIGR